MSIRSRIISLAHRGLSKLQSKLERHTPPIALLESINARVAAVQHDTPGETFGSYAERWLARRIASAKGLRSRKDIRSVLDTHLLPVFGNRPIGEVTVKDVRAFINKLVKKPHRRSTPEKPRVLANNTIHSIYSVLRAIFSRAVQEDIITQSPCRLGAEDMPEKTHAIEDFGKFHLYEREEMLAILDLENTGAHALPDYWRQLYRAAYWTGGRIGEVCALTFARVELDLKPLGKVTLAKSFSSKNKEVGPTKTGDIKELPIHPQWEPHFREWCEHGYERYTGRKPTPDAIVFPAKGRGKKNRGKLLHRLNTVVLHRLHDDLEAMGFTKRRTHDFRRTFITMISNTEGINKDLLVRLTHSRGGSAHESYVEHEFAAVCREFIKVRLEISTPVLVDNVEKREDENKTDEQSK